MHVQEDMMLTEAIYGVKARRLLSHLPALGIHSSDAPVSKIARAVLEHSVCTINIEDA